VYITEDFIQPHPRHYSQEPSQYDQGPRGDPFAPQPAPYLHIQEEVVPPPTKPPKRKRKPRREPECGFCQGDDKKNKEAEPEVMVTCEECGRSGTCNYPGQNSNYDKTYIKVIRAVCNLAPSQTPFVHILGSAPNVKLAKFVKKRAMM
jgi:hypothetical protein